MMQTPAENSEFCSARKVCERYGIVDRTLDRWLQRTDVAFPPPDMVVNGRRFWKEGSLQVWERSRAASKREAA
jgi:predicted DNA-binding transcriptional regulator AlpA